MSSTSTPPFENCKDFVVIGYTVSCGAEGVSAGIDTEGDYMMRISVDWDPASLTNQDTFYLGSTRKGYQHHARRDVGNGPINIDTSYEGGTSPDASDRDDTQDIADQQAYDVEEAVDAGDIPPDLISVDTDGGEPGNCHGRVKIWCPKHVDIGNNCSKVRIYCMMVGDKAQCEFKPASAGPRSKEGPWDPTATEKNTDWECVIPPGKRKEKTNEMNPYLDAEQDKIEGDKSKPPATPKPASPERGKELRDARKKRRPNKKISCGLPANAEMVCVVGSWDAIDDKQWSNVDLDSCQTARISCGSDTESRINALEQGFVASGVRVTRSGDSLRVHGFADGRALAVIGFLATEGG